MTFRLRLGGTILVVLLVLVALSASTVASRAAAMYPNLHLEEIFNYASVSPSTSAATTEPIPQGWHYDYAPKPARAASTSPASALATKAGTSIVKYDADFAIGQLTSRGAKASDLTRVAKSQGWRRVQNPDGPIKYLDDSGVPRLTLKSGSARAPGSNFPHVEVRNAAGRRVDPYGNPVTRRSPGNHTPIDWDLP